MDRGNKTVTLNVRMEGKIKDVLQKLAERDRRTLSDYVRLQLENIAKSIKK